MGRQQGRAPRLSRELTREQLLPVSIGHEPAIDGLRGYGVLMVALFHAGITPEDTGAYAIGAFFTISGFIITHLLLREWRATGRVKSGRFLSQRLIRLYPSLVVTVAGITAWAWWIGPAVLRSELAGSSISALAHVYNFFLLRSTVTGYTELFINRSPWTHLWSVSIEEQFYLVVGPLVALAAARRTKDFVRWLTWGLAIAAVGTAGWQVIGALSGESPFVAYLRTDNRVSEFLIGAVAGVAHSRGAFRFWVGRWVGVVGYVALAAVTLSWWFVPRDEIASYMGGLQLHALAISLIVVTACGVNSFRSGLSNPALRALGRWSYGIYLLHWPAIVAFQFAWGPGSKWIALLAVAASIVAAAALTVGFERPIRRWGKDRPRVVLTALIAAGVVVALASAALGRQWTGNEAEGALEARGVQIPDPAVDDQRPRVIVLGDSLAKDLLGSLVALDPDQVWVDRAARGCSLSAQEIDIAGKWQTQEDAKCLQLLDETVGLLRPQDTVIFLFGSVDSRSHRKGAEVAEVGTAKWRSVVGGELTDYFERITETGARLVAVDLVPSTSRDGMGYEVVTAAQAKDWNKLLNDLVKSRFPKVKVVALPDFTTNGNDPRRRIGDCTVRGRDGFHWAQCGADLIAERIVDVVRQS